MLFKVPFSRTLKGYVSGYMVSQYCGLDGWVFSPKRANMLVGELSNWLVNYCPVDLVGKVVLDVGAGEGESAKFFLQKGAKKVVAVEFDSACFGNLCLNARRFSVEVVARKFCVGDLFREDIDFAKVDIEGYEEAILGYKPVVPCVVEVHGLQLRDRFRSEGWRVTDCEVCQCICYAFWKC